MRIGGRNVLFEKKVYANLNLTLVDDTSIYVGNYTLFGPNVTLATAGHHVLPELRKQGYQFNVPIYHDKDFILKIKRYIWLNIYVKGSALRNWVY